MADSFTTAIPTPFISPLGYLDEELVPIRPICLVWDQDDLYRLETRVAMRLVSMGYPADLRFQMKPISSDDADNSLDTGYNQMFIIIHQFKGSNELSEQQLKDIVDYEYQHNQDLTAILSFNNIGVPIEWLQLIIPYLTIPNITVEMFHNNMVSGIFYSKLMDRDGIVAQEILNNLNIMYSQYIVPPSCIDPLARDFSTIYGKLKMIRSSLIIDDLPIMAIRAINGSTDSYKLNFSLDKYPNIVSKLDTFNSAIGMSVTDNFISFYPKSLSEIIAVYHLISE